MHRRGDERRERRLHELAAMLRHTELAADDGLRGGRAETREHLWLHHFEFRLEPRVARGDLLGARAFVDAAFPAWRPLEVLDRVRDVHGVAVDAGLLQGLVEQTTGGTDERAALEVLPVARLLADHHDLRARTPLAEHGLGRVAEQIASLAACSGLRERGKRALLRKEVRGGALQLLARHLGCPSPLRGGDADVPAVPELRADRARPRRPPARQATGRGAPVAPRAARSELRLAASPGRQDVAR